jgi:hypothetical protein
MSLVARLGGWKSVHFRSSQQNGYNNSEQNREILNVSACY